MDQHLRRQRDTSLDQLEDLIRRGRQIKGTVDVDGLRAWQRDCAAAINEMSGGSKAHWLARAYSGAFLVRAADGGVVVEASASEIVDRILDVLAQARSSLSSLDSLTTGATPPARRFDFVYNPQLRPILAQAFADGARALEKGDVESSFLSSCGILETLITDALERKGLSTSEWSFDARIEAAERAGLIGRGCSRLPAVARRYRDLAEQHAHGETISERDARVVRQVLTVVMRDLDPGR
jgi:hypothetical protein